MKLENKTVEELKNMCRNKKISGYSKLNKQGLVDLLSNNKKVKKGGTGYDLSFKDLEKGKYYECSLAPYNNKHKNYVGKLITKTGVSATFHRHEFPNNENLYGAFKRSPHHNNLRGIYIFNNTGNKENKNLFTQLTSREVQDLGFEVWNKKGGAFSLNQLPSVRNSPFISQLY